MWQEQIESLFDKPPDHYSEKHLQLFQQFKDGLNEGSVRAAEPDAASPTGWRVNGWVKKGILLGFRMGAVVAMSTNGQAFFDKSTYPLRNITLANAVRIVPGGSSLRDCVNLVTKRRLGTCGLNGQAEIAPRTGDAAGEDEIVAEHQGVCCRVHIW